MFKKFYLGAIYTKSKFKKICFFIKNTTRWIFACKINKKQVCVNKKKYVILASKKLKFKIQLYVEPNTKGRIYFVNQIIILCDWVKLLNLMKYMIKVFFNNPSYCFE